MSEHDDPLLLPPPQRRRAYSALFSGVAVSTVGLIAVATVTSLVAEDLTGTAAWSGVPGAATVMGTALGTTALAELVRRVGPWTGMTIGYGLAAVSIAAAALAIASGSFPWFIVTLFLFGAGFGANRLARYVAADLYPVSKRATMIGWIVWASTIGAVAGPMLLAPARAVAERIAVNGLVGPFLLCAVAVTIAAVITILGGRVSSTAGHTGHAGLLPPVPPPDSLSVLWRRPGVRQALLSMVSGHFVMVLVMTMTPVHLRHDGHGLGAIGAVISAHTLGMFALSPITGALADRYGRRRVLGSAVVVLLTACATAVAAALTGSYPLTLLSLFLLGVGWNGGFVGGSALLTDSVPVEARTRVQGLGDMFVWGGGAVASLASGWLLARTGFAGLALIGAAISLVPVAALIRSRTVPAVLR